jgi:competence protein ComEC
VKALAAAFREWWLRPERRRAYALFFTATAACAGILTANALPRWSLWTWLLILTAAAILAGKWRSPWSWLMLCAAAFGLLHHVNDSDPLRRQVDALLPPGHATPAEVTGVISDAPEPDASGSGLTFPLRIEHLTATLLPDEFRGARLYVHLREVTTALRYGDRIEFHGLLRRPQPPRNPGEFDFPSFLRREGLSAEFESAEPQSGLQVMERDAGNPLIASALRSREWIGSAVTAGITHDPDIAATVRTMVLGTREKTPSEVEDAFRASGTMHIFAVSGLHVAMFCGVVFWVLRRTPLPYGWILLIALPLVFYYVYITGLRPSAWRAALMSAVYLLAPLGDRESRLYNSLGASALLLLTWNTQQLFQPGFSLSFGVLLAIAVLFPFFRKAFARFAEPDPFLPRQLHTRGQTAVFRTREFVATSIALSCASTIGSAPLMIHYFSLITPVGIVANIFLVLLSYAILIVACASLLTSGTGLGLLALACNHLNWLLALISVKLAQFFAAIPGGHLNVHPSQWLRGDVCEITVLNLDSGGAGVLIHTPGDRQWLVDSGGLRHYHRSVRPFLTRTAVNRLDGMILTHGDTYHTGAADEVRRDFHPRAEPSLRAGEELPLDDGVILRCLFPPSGWNANATDDRCAVFLLRCRDTRILLMNDAGFVTEKALLESGEDLRADILIKGRHGSDFSGLPEFFNAVRPQSVIFTNSAFPQSEFVPDEWKAMLASKGIHYSDQSRTGAVIIRIEAAITNTRGFIDGSTREIRRPL